MPFETNQNQPLKGAPAFQSNGILNPSQRGPRPAARPHGLLPQPINVFHLETQMHSQQVPLGCTARQGKEKKEKKQW